MQLVPFAFVKSVSVRGPDSPQMTDLKMSAIKRPQIPATLNQSSGEAAGFVQRVPTGLQRNDQ